MVLRCQQCGVPWCYGATVHEAAAHGGTLAPWHRDTLAPWHRRTLAPWPPGPVLLTFAERPDDPRGRMARNVHGDAHHVVAGRQRADRQRDRRHQPRPRPPPRGRPPEWRRPAPARRRERAISAPAVTPGSHGAIEIEVAERHRLAAEQHPRHEAAARQAEHQRADLQRPDGGARPRPLRSRPRRCGPRRRWPRRAGGTCQVSARPARRPPAVPSGTSASAVHCATRRPPSSNRPGRRRRQLTPGSAGSIRQTIFNLAIFGIVGTRSRRRAAAGRETPAPRAASSAASPPAGLTAGRLSGRGMVMFGRARTETPSRGDAHVELAARAVAIARLHLEAERVVRRPSRGRRARASSRRSPRGAGARAPVTPARCSMPSSGLSDPLKPAPAMFSDLRLPGLDHQVFGLNDVEHRACRADGGAQLSEHVDRQLAHARARARLPRRGADRPFPRSRTARWSALRARRTRTTSPTSDSSVRRVRHAISEPGLGHRSLAADLSPARRAPSHGRWSGRHAEPSVRHRHERRRDRAATTRRGSDRRRRAAAARVRGGTSRSRSRARRTGRRLRSALLAKGGGIGAGGAAAPWPAARQPESTPATSRNGRGRPSAPVLPRLSGRRPAGRRRRRRGSR